MKSIVEKLLEDVDSDIRDLMMSDADMTLSPLSPNDIATGFMHIASTNGPHIPQATPLKNWEMIDDPLFFIIKWQELRHENRQYQGNK